MKAVLIGVSDKSILWRHGKLKKEEYTQFVGNYVKILSGYVDELIITPDDGVYLDIAREFGTHQGKTVTGFIPDKDTQYGHDHLEKNSENIIIKPINGDWYTLNAELTKQANVVICLGFSPGSLIELSYVKYHQKYGGCTDIHVLIDDRCINERLPASFTEQIKHIHYFSSFEELQSLLQDLKA